MTGLQSSSLGELEWVRHGFGTRRNEAIPESASLKQIHSNRVIIAQRMGVLGEGDALVTDRPGIAVAVRTADCYPILLADTRNHAVAAIHAGWRGTAARIVIKTLEMMRSEFGTNPFEVRAAIGPGIGVCCYEVGDEVALEFGKSGQTHVDLLFENRRQLESSGVPAGNIEALGVCTFCDTERFFSYRRDKEKAGRMTSFVEIRPR